jgi:hypothetical protein
VASPNYFRHFTGILCSAALVKILARQRKWIFEKAIVLALRPLMQYSTPIDTSAWSRPCVAARAHTVAAVRSTADNNKWMDFIFPIFHSSKKENGKAYAIELTNSSGQTTNRDKRNLS